TAIPSALAASSTDLTTGAWTALPGFQTTVARLRTGITSFRSWSRFAAISGKKKDAPVKLPPGRARLVTRPAAIGSPVTVITIGIVVVACFATRVGGGPSV